MFVLAWECFGDTALPTTWVYLSLLWGCPGTQDSLSLQTQPPEFRAETWEVMPGEHLGVTAIHGAVRGWGWILDPFVLQKVWECAGLLWEHSVGPAHKARHQGLPAVCRGAQWLDSHPQLRAARCPFCNSLQLCMTSLGWDARTWEPSWPPCLENMGWLWPF